MLATHPLGVLIGYLADRALGDPRRGHPVALFGRAVAGLENLTYRDGRVAGALHVGVSIGAVGLLGLAVHRAAARAGPRWSIAATAAAGWVCSGGTSLTWPSCCSAGRRRAGPGRAGIGRGEHLRRAGGAAVVGGGRWGACGAGVSRHQHAGRDDRSPLAALSPIRLGRSEIGRHRQLPGGAGDRVADGAAGAGGRRPQRRRGGGGVRRGAGRAAGRAHGTSCRSARPSAPVASPR